MYKGRYIIALVLARVGSARLRNKMLLPFLEFETVFEAVLDRVFKCNLVDEIILATSKKPVDDKLEKIAIKHKLKVFRGSEKDVVARMYEAAGASSSPPQVVVRVCSDNPLLMPMIVDEAVAELVDTNVDLITPFEFNSYPFGFSSAVMTFSCLAKINSEAKSTIYREHVENFCFDHQEKFSVCYQRAPEALNYPELCLTLDYQIDYDRLIMYGKAICNRSIDEQPLAVIEKLNKVQVGIIGFDKRALSRLVPESVEFFEEKESFKDKKLDLIFSVSPFEGLPEYWPSRGVIWPDSCTGELKCLYKSTKPFSVYKLESKNRESNAEYFTRVLPKAINFLLAGPLRPFNSQHKTGEKNIKG